MASFSILGTCWHQTFFYLKANSLTQVLQKKKMGKKNVQKSYFKKLTTDNFPQLLTLPDRVF